MDDVDLLARPSQLDALREGLERMGLETLPRHPDLLVGRGLTLDLHGDLLDSSRISSRKYGGWMDPDAVWRCRRVIEIEGVPIWTLSLEDSFLYAVVHALKHGYSKYSWFFDLHFLLIECIDWDRLLQRAAAFNLQRPLL